MPHTCEDCGETFGTLSKLRLHDCPGDEEHETTTRNDAFGERAAERRSKRRAEEREARQAVGSELTDALDRATEGDANAVHELLAHYERELVAARDRDDDSYWGLHRAFYEPAATALLDASEREGWPYLLEVLNAYWPETSLDLEGYDDLPRRDYDRRHDDRDAFPDVSHVLTDAAARLLIRTRRREGVSAVPADALAYLLPFHRHPGDDGPWTESMPYGWGIGHQEHPFVENVVALVEGDYDIWVGAAVEHAFHADQHAAINLLETVFERVDVPESAMLFRGVAAIERGRYPSEPKHAEWEAVYPEFGADGFDWDPDVRGRIRTLVDRSGILAHRDDWSFTDLEV